MHNLGNLSVADLAALSRAILRAGQEANSMEACAQSVVRYLYDNLVTDSGEPACALVRFFKTHSLGDLTPDLRSAALSALPAGLEPNPGMKCLTLLATAGIEEDWNSRATSRGHRTIPLPSAKMVEQFPMISQLIRQLGFQLSEIVTADQESALQLQQRGSNVFYVPSALGSPHIPAQKDFVLPYGVQSVIGLGDILPSGNLFVIVLFTRTHVSRERAEMLNILSVGVKAAVLKYDYGTVFASVSA
jgi:hypothetical protein